MKVLALGLAVLSLNLLAACDRHNTVHVPGGMKIESSPYGKTVPPHCPPGHAKKGWC